MNKFIAILFASIIVWSVYFFASVISDSINFDSQIFIYIAVSSSLLIANVGRNNQSDAIKTLIVLQVFINIISIGYVNFGNKNYVLDIAFGVVCATIAMFSIYFKMKNTKAIN